MRPGASVGYVQATRPASRVLYVPDAQGGLPPGRHVLYVLGTRASLGRTVRTAYRVATQVIDWVIARITGQIFTEQVAMAKRMRAEPGRSEHVRAVEADPSFYEGWLAPRLARAALRAEG